VTRKAIVGEMENTGLYLKNFCSFGGWFCFPSHGKMNKPFLESVIVIYLTNKED